MKKISLYINNRSVLQEHLINHFKDAKYVFFFNSNNQNEKNILAISNSEKVEDNNWKIGFISYDYKNNIEQLTSNGIDEIGFPDEFFFTPQLIIEISESALEISYSSKVYNETDLLILFADLEKHQRKNHQANTVVISPRISKEEYLENVCKLKQHIQQGDIYEVNYCQEFFANQIEINPIETYFKLNKKSPTPFSCFVKFNDKYLLCASPERFIKKVGNKISSQPIKGTIKRGATLAEDEQLKIQLQNDPKERSENIMIVDLVRNDLAKIAERNSVKVDELCGIYTFPQVHQMISTISAELKKEVDFKQIIHALFPMGSMTGAPKIRAMELIEQYEKSKRGLYSGTVGFIKPTSDFDFNVVIRSILYNASSKKISYFVGSAITSLSVPEKEYEECLLKAKAINEVLSLND
ncbi:MAG: aminodeoxychorismate synthase component I [Flavobacteriales bacterium]|nr:aminodeoxychorismate synthase component I [Flavobacteriales bacterium]MCL4856888.1 aminodeoxychorismate synthase component I [Flavobacteriales bacterium]